MAFRRRFYGRRSFRPRYRRRFVRSSRSFRGRFMRRSRKLAAEFSALRGLARKELKIYDTVNPLINIPVSTTWAGCEFNPATILCLNGPAQGSLINQRQGMKINIHSIHFQAFLERKSVTSTTSIEYFDAQCCIALVQEFDVFGSELVSESVFSSVNAIPDHNAIPLRNTQYLADFKVLKMWRYSASQGTFALLGAAPSATHGTPCSKIINYYKKLNMVTVFNGTAAGVANMLKNSLSIICNSTVSAMYAMTYQCRVVFSDF